MMMYQNDQEAVVVTETAAETDCSRSHQLLRELNQLPESSCNPDQLQLLYKRLLIDPVLDGQDLKQLQSVNLFSWNLLEFSPPLLWDRKSHSGWRSLYRSHLNPFFLPDWLQLGSNPSLSPCLHLLKLRDHQDWGWGRIFLTFFFFIYSLYLVVAKQTKF